jgi:hypothetical protein
LTLKNGQSKLFYLEILRYVIYILNLRRNAMQVHDKIKGHCHCQSVKWTFVGNFAGATACNCTVCRRYGALWVYGYLGVGEDIEIIGETQSYSRGPETISFNFCPKCACVVSWTVNKKTSDGRVKCALNIRMIENPELAFPAYIEHFDGLNTFEDLPRDGKCIKDLWF